MKVTARDRYILIAAVAARRPSPPSGSWACAEARQAQQARQGPDVGHAVAGAVRAGEGPVRPGTGPVPDSLRRVGRLGKAVPPTRSPLAARAAQPCRRECGVDFRSIELKLDLADKLATAAPAATAATPATGATGASGATGGAGATTASATTPAGGATATGAATGTLQPLPFQYKFEGNFYSLENLIHNVSRLVNSRNRQLAISGRLIVIQGFALKRKKITIVATSYMLPADQGLFAGATAAGPGGTTAATPQPATSAGGSITPPTAAVTTP